MISSPVTMWKTIPIVQRRMILMLLAAIGLANIAQPFPDLAPLQHGPTVALTLAAPWLLRRWPLSTFAVACIWLFLLLHTLGARWIYSYVPYDDWARAVSGHDLSSLFGTTRNGYDRLVHFSFGAMLTLPIAEFARRHGGLSWDGACVSPLPPSALAARCTRYSNGCSPSWRLAKRPIIITGSRATSGTRRRIWPLRRPVARWRSSRSCAAGDDAISARQARP